MDFESNAGFFESVVADHPLVHVVEPKFDVRGIAKSVSSKFDADFVFGPEHSNQEAKLFYNASP